MERLKCIMSGERPGCRSELGFKSGVGYYSLHYRRRLPEKGMKRTVKAAGKGARRSAQLKRVLFAIIIGGLVTSFSTARSLEVSGRFTTDIVSYGEHLSSLNNDNASFKLFATITPSRAVDASIIVDAEKRAYFESAGLQDYRYRLLYLRYRSRRYELYLGRQYISEAIGTSLDGVRTRIRLGKSAGVGCFAGIKADPYRRGFQRDYTLFGVFSSANRGLFDASASYVAEYYKGRLNRGYVVFQSNFRYKMYLRFFENLTVDTDKDLKPFYLTYANLGLYVTPFKRAGFSCTYSRYRAYQEYALVEKSYSASFYPTHRYAFRGNVRANRYLSFDASRGFTLRALDNSRTHFYALSVSTRDVVLAGLRNFVRFSRSWGSIYTNATVSLGGSIFFSGKHSLSGSFSWQRNETGFASASSSGYGASLAFYSTLVKRIRLGLTYSYNNSAGPTQNGFFTHLGYRF